MPSTVEELSNTRVKVTIQIPFAEVKPALDRAYREIAEQINVPGFRKGKVPPMVIDQRVGRPAVLQEAINQVMPEVYGQALREHSIVPLSEPDVELEKMDDGEEIVFTAELDRRPDFEVPSPESITVKVDTKPSLDDEVDARIETLRERFATTAEVERAAQDGDVVTANLSASRDGEPLPDASAEGVTFRLGVDQMLDGLKDAAEGLSAGESKTFTSELVGGDMKGQAADITVEVLKVAEHKLPEVDDEFAAMVSQFDTVDEMRADLGSEVEQQLALGQAAQAQEKVVEELVSQATLELPESYVEREVEARREGIQQQLQQIQMDLATYLEQTGDERTEEEFWKELEEGTDKGARAEIVLDKAADDLEIGIEQDDVTQYLFQAAQRNGTTAQQEAEALNDQNRMNQVLGDIRRNKALALLTSQAKAFDADGNPVDLTVLAPKAPETPTFSEVAEAAAKGDLEQTDAE